MFYDIFAVALKSFTVILSPLNPWHSNLGVGNFEFCLWKKKLPSRYWVVKEARIEVSKLDRKHLHAMSRHQTCGLSRYDGITINVQNLTINYYTYCLTLSECVGGKSSPATPSINVLYKKETVKNCFSSCHLHRGNNQSVALHTR